MAQLTWQRQGLASYLEPYALFGDMLSSFIIPIEVFDTGPRAPYFQGSILYMLIPIFVFETTLNMNNHVMRPLIGSILLSATINMSTAT